MGDGSNLDHISITAKLSVNFTTWIVQVLIQIPEALINLAKAVVENTAGHKRENQFLKSSS